MKITLITIGSTGDVRPFILIGHALQQRGHEVTIAALSAFEKTVTDAGLAFFPLAGDAQALMENLMRPGVQGVAYLAMVIKSLRKIAPVLLEDLLRAGEGADALVCNYFGTMYYSVAEYYDIPIVQSHFFPMDQNDDVPMSSAGGLNWGRAWNRLSYRLGYLGISTVEQLLLRSWRRKHGMKQRRIRCSPDYQVNGHRVRAMYGISPHILPPNPAWGENIRMMGFYWEAPDAQAALSPALEAFLNAGEPPIYVGFGSMDSGDMQATIDTVLAGIRQSGLRAVVCLGWSGAGHSEEDARIFYADYVAHDKLFPRVRAVVHHGGAGTFSAGLRHGRPTLVIPFGGDQPFWGDRARRLGLGPAPIPRTRLTAEAFAAALRDLVETPAYTENAAALAEKLRAENGVENAADFIEKAIAEW